MSYSATSTLSFPTFDYSASPYSSGGYPMPGGIQSAASPLWGSVSSGSSGDPVASDASGSISASEMDLLVLMFLLEMTESADDGSSGDEAGLLNGLESAGSGSGGGVETASDRTSSGSGTRQRGDANVTRAGSGNPAGVAEDELNQSAASLMQNQQVPMQKGVDTTLCCANFASACLVKSGELPGSQQTTSVSTLHSELTGEDGWRAESRSEAKPGDICIVGNNEHVEIVASNDNGRITLVGSNNTDHGSGPQVVSYDTYTGNTGDVTFLTQ